jgi:arylsulfatase A-like enzyme
MLPAAYSDHLALEEVTIAEKFKQAGYATFFAGKWHLGGEGFWPEDQGFDVNRGGIDRGGPYGGKKYFSPYGNPRLKDGPDGEHLPDRLAAETANFIAANKDKPFFAYLSFYSVHTPLMARDDLKQEYLELKSRIRLRGPIWGTEGKNKFRMVQEHAVYAAMVTAMDQAVGKVLKSIDENGVAENTVVIFMSDNGGLATSEGHPTTNLPLRAGKGWIYEGGIREPMLVRAPGVTTAATECNQYVSSVDFYPTMLELAGQPKDTRADVDGVSFVPLLEGKKLDRGPIFWHYPHYGNQGGSPSAAIRDGKWKLIQWLETDDVSLYDIDADIGEKNDLASQHTDVVLRMKNQLTAWQKDVDAKQLGRRD